MCTFTRVSHSAIRGALLAAIIFVGTLLCRTLTAESPRDRILAAATSSSLDGPGLKPWHLKLNVTLYDDDGKNPISGTIERWNADNGSRTVFTFGDATRTILNDGDNHYASHTGPEVPALADGVLEEILSPGPSDQDVQTSTPDLQTESFGKVKLDCIMLSQPIHHNAPFSIGLFPTYCMDPGGQLLRASFNFGSYTVLRNDITEFQARFIPHTLYFIEGQRTHVADVKVETLELFTPKPDEFTPGPEMKPSTLHSWVQVPGGILAGHILKKVPPIYPASARQAHISGTVVLHAIIGRDGHIRYLRPVSAPDTDLALASIAAVRQWTYSPYLLNGEPTEVDTTITVNFNLN